MMPEEQHLTSTSTQPCTCGHPSLPPNYLETRNEDFSEVKLENNEILGERILLFG